MNYELELRKILKDIKTIEKIEEATNKVFKLTMNDDSILYAKFYLNITSHIDHEINLYDKVDNKYLKELVYSSNNPKLAIFKELKGITLDQIEDKEKYADDIIDSLCKFFDDLNKIHVNGYGILDNNMNGKYTTFNEFIIDRQTKTSNELIDYPKLSNLFNLIYSKYSDIIVGDNGLTPIDTNMKNIMIINDEVKFIDPGQLISGPILMAYGDFVAHTYKTVLYDKLIEKLSLNENDKKLLRIYAIFSSLNTLAFLHSVGVTNLEEITSFGNKYTFCSLIDEHLKYLEI